MSESKNKRQLNLVARLAIADPKTVAEALLYEVKHGETEVMTSLAKLLEANRNEAGKNVSAVVATATLLVNQQPNYLFDETDLAQSILSHLSLEQIDALYSYNCKNLCNPEAEKDLISIREIFGTTGWEVPNEGNTLLANFLRDGRQFAAPNDLKAPDQKPEITSVQGANIGLLMLSMCLELGYLPLMRHDGSHILSGFNAVSAEGEIHNQTYDLASNALAQYGVLPTLREQRLNRTVIYSFYGIPEQLGGLKRDWRDFVNQSLETWRQFFMENPGHLEKWGLKGLVDDNMRMVKADGSPLIS